MSPTSPSQHRNSEQLRRDYQEEPYRNDHNDHQVEDQDEVVQDFVNDLGRHGEAIVLNREIPLPSSPPRNPEASINSNSAPGSDPFSHDQMVALTSFLSLLMITSLVFNRPASFEHNTTEHSGSNRSLTAASATQLFLAQQEGRSS